MMINGGPRFFFLAIPDLENIIWGNLIQQIKNPRLIALSHCTGNRFVVRENDLTSATGMVTELLPKMDQVIKGFNYQPSKPVTTVQGGRVHKRGRMYWGWTFLATLFFAWVFSRVYSTHALHAFWRQPICLAHCDFMKSWSFTDKRSALFSSEGILPWLEKFREFYSKYWKMGNLIS